MTNLQVLVLTPKVLVLVILRSLVLDNNTDCIRLHPLMSETRESKQLKESFKIADPKSKFLGQITIFPAKVVCSQVVTWLYSTSQIIHCESKKHST